MPHWVYNMAEFRYAESSLLTNPDYLLSRDTKETAAADSAVDYSLLPTDLSDRERAVLGRAIRTGTSDPGDADATTNYLLSGDSPTERAAFLSNALADEAGGQAQSDYDEAETANRIADRMDAEASANTVGMSTGAVTSKGRPNPLDPYANYTYGLTMRAITTAAYNSGEYNGKVLVASAGRRGNGYERAQAFHEDFYFDNFKMTSVIGLNSRTRSSNAISMQFTIIEPYGITFMNRLLAVAKELGAKNWNEMPFVMQIDFYGNSDDGTPINPIPGQSKIIPFKLIECKIKASARGSEYQCTAVPYNHQAFQESVATTPAIFEMRAKQVKDFFDNKKTSGSFTDALNKHNTNLSKDDEKKKYKKVQDTADEYAFEIDDEIAEATIVSSNKISSSRAPMAAKNNPTGTKVNGAEAAQTGGAVTLDMDSQLISINAGTSIIDAINLVIRNSNYITNQLGPNADSKVIDWFKIIPKIEIKEFDKIRKLYQKKITYKVIKSTYHNTKYIGAPIKLPEKWAKEYNYMYTGLNQSVIDFSIDFDTMFYTAMTAFRAKESELETQPGESEKETAEVKNNTQESSIAPLQTRAVIAQTDVTSKEGNNDEKSVAAGDLYKSMMSSSRGDMINVKLKISGDPEFIKQDDFYITEASSDLVNGSIATDSGEVFVYVRFRSPSDLIEETGLMDFTTYSDTVFSGIYKIITVDTVFERGQFTQVLDLVRLFNQEGDLGNTKGGKSSKERNKQAAGMAESAAALAIDESTRMLESATDYSDYGSATGIGAAGTSQTVTPQSVAAENATFTKIKDIQDATTTAAETARLLARYPTMNIDLEKTQLFGP